MSGFEIAGAVLGAFPLLVEGLKGARSRFADVRTWWQFDRAFQDFVFAIEHEHVVYSQTLVLLFDPILDRFELDDAEVNVLLNESDSPLWHDYRVQETLKRRVEPHASWFFRQLADIKEVIEEIRQFLPVGKAHLLVGGSVESELFRLKASFSHKKDDLLSKLREKNSSIYGFLDRASHSSQRTASLPAGTTSIGARKDIAALLERQKDSAAVQKYLWGHWECRCRCSGNHGYGVSIYDSAFRLLHNNADKHSAYLEFLVKHNAVVPRETATSSRPDELTVLSEQLSFKSRVKKLKDRGYGSIFKLVGSSASVAAAPQGGVLGMSGLKRKERKLEKIKKSKMGKASSNQVQFSVPPTLASEPRTAAPRTEIGDLCTIVSAPDHTRNSKYLGDFDLAPFQIALSLYSHSSQRQDSSAHTLGDFMQSTPKRHDRLKLGLKIMLTVLSLGACWVPETLSKQSMILFDPAATQESEIIPFLLSESKQTATRQKQRDAGETAKKVLLAVGILLLELLFQETIESRPDRPLYLSSGQPEELANLLTAISWQQGVEAEYGSKISEAIRQCVVCGFGIAPNLGDRAFLQAVWLGVVQPLEDFLKAYA